MDDCGALVILQLRRMAEEHGCALEMLGTPGHVQELLDFLRLDDPPRSGGVKRAKPGIMTRFGIKTIEVTSQAMTHVSFVGEVTVTLLSLLRHPGRLRLGDVVLYMQRVGVDALPIVGLISFLLGLIMAFMSAVQLQQFGANIYVASLVALAMVRELGPIMTAILVAGRSGSAFAAEIGTMKVSEEVDALITMGFKPAMFLVAPKIIASLLVVPLLAMYSNLFAIAGGLLIGVTTLDLTVNAYMAQTMNTLTIFDINWGLFKSAIFAVLIATVGCFKGYQVRGGAASVGQATTSAVVTGIFLVILVDSVLAVILRYWRP
jgi:phospholipid/cholesterol/gamma-HCH transport system permease protein